MDIRFFFASQAAVRRPAARPPARPSVRPATSTQWLRPSFRPHGCKKIFTFIFTRLNLTKPPESLRESTPVVIPQQFHVPVTRSAWKTRRERALYLSIAPEIEINRTGNLHYKRNPFENRAGHSLYLLALCKGISFIMQIYNANNFNLWCDWTFRFIFWRKGDNSIWSWGRRY